MSRLKVAVVGCGHLGSIHARLLNSLEEVELVGVVDPVCRSSRSEWRRSANAKPWQITSELIGPNRCRRVATPTIYHHDVALDLLQQNVHLLIEKPMTSTVAEANELIATARPQNLVLQVGHVERFNPAWNAVAPHLAVASVHRSGARRYLYVSARPMSVSCST